MIAYLSGEIIRKNEKSIIINTGNIGYLVHVNKNIISTIDDKNAELFIYSHIREDAFDLYGFSNFEELEFFKQLISVNGIGPKAGLEILNTDIENIKSAIINEDIAFITKTPGIGKKTAERLILELKNKITTSTLIRTHNNIESNINDDIIEALTNMGFTRQAITKTLEKLPKSIKKENEIISFFLKNN